jgi:GT2 family glycosyltransferase
MNTACDVIIVNYNAGNLLKNAVTSVLKSSNTHVFVIDNNSSDDSLSLLSTLNQQERLEIIKNKENQGFAFACNQGIYASSAETLLFLNPDAVLENDDFQHLMSVLASDKNIGMVGGVLKDEDGTEQGGGRRSMPTPWRLFVRATGLYRLKHWWPNVFYDLHMDKQPLPDKPIEVEAISGACMLVRKEAIEKVGLWDEGYFLHVEDLDWCQRFRLAGFRILFVPDADVIHHKGSCSQRRPVWVEWHKHRGMLRFYRKFLRKNYPGPLMWVVTLGIWLRFGAVAIVKTVKSIL